MGLGTDMVAGEKERGTLASLLVSPIRRSSIILGKVFSLMVIAGLSSIISVVAMIVFMPVMFGGDFEAAGISVNMSMEQILMLGALLVLISFMYATIIVLISVFAKSVKEANTYIYPVYILLMVVGFSTMFDIGTPGDFVYYIPLYNSILTLQNILTQSVTPWQYVVTVITTAATSIVLIFALTKLFGSEKIMSK
jgi:sodium transport system permease protein